MCIRDRTHTGIAAIDGALNAHIQSIKEKGIQYDEDISKILHLGSIVPGDLALIISLALDNAKEACENIEMCIRDSLLSFRWFDFKRKT